MAIRPEDILPDDANFATLNNTVIRKGSIAAAIANVEVIESANTSNDEKNAAKEVLAALAQQLKTTNFVKHLTWNNPEVQALFQ